MIWLRSRSSQCRAAVVGDEQAPGADVLDERVDELRVRRRVMRPRPGPTVLRQALAVRRRRAPSTCSAVVALGEAAARRLVGAVAAGAKLTALAAEVPHAGEQMFRVRRIHRDRRAAGREVRALEDQRPGLAAVGRLVDAAVRRVAPQLARRAGVDGVAVLRDRRRCSRCARVRQAHVGPGLAAVGRFVDAVADRDGVARPALAGADPDHLRVGRIERDRADRLHRLLVEHRLEGRAAVDRLPHAAGRGADESVTLPSFS